jgi:peptidoglycan/LPS O-acetylase OafA/YrhL
MSIPSNFYAFDLGTFGVLLFFTLSGTTLYISNSNKPFSVKTFLIKRIFRIWPAFAASLVFYVLFRSLFMIYYPEPSGNWIELQFLKEFQSSDVIHYLTMTSNIWGVNGLFNNAYWSLPVEFQYYLGFPLLYICIKKAGIPAAFLIGALLYLIYKFQLSSFNEPRVFMLGFSFCFGAAIGHFYINNKPKKLIKGSGILLLLTFAMAVFMTNNIEKIEHIPFISSLWNCYIILAAIAVYIVLFHEPQIPKTLKPKLMQLGEISYSLYLFHNLIIASLLLLFINMSFSSGYMPFLTLLALTILLAWVVSYFTYNMIERQGIKLGRTLCEKIVKSSNNI